MSNEPTKVKASDNLKSALKMIQVASDIIKRENPKATHLIQFFNRQKGELCTFLLPKDNEENLYKDVVTNLDAIYSDEGGEK